MGRQVIKTTTDQTKQHLCCRRRHRQVSGEESPFGAERSTPTAATSCLTCRHLAQTHTQFPPPPSTFCSHGPLEVKTLTNDPLLVTCRVSSILNYWEITFLVQVLLFLQLLRQHVTSKKAKAVFFNLSSIKPAVSEHHLQSGKSSSTCTAAGQPLITHDAAHCFMTFKRKSYLQTINILK